MDESIIISCNCGCELLKISDIDYKEDKCIYLEIFTSSFYEKQDGIFRTLIHRIKLAFYMLFGREFSLFDMIVDEKEVKKLKNYLDKLLEDDDGTAN